LFHYDFCSCLGIPANCHAVILEFVREKLAFVNVKIHNQVIEKTLKWNFLQKNKNFITDLEYTTKKDQTSKG
jgi:hypothetical protein